MIGEEVRRRREELGLTGAQLAARAGMAPSTVSQIETGKRSPSSASVMKLAQALGIEAGDLFPLEQPRLPELVPPGKTYFVPLEEGEEEDTVTLEIHYVWLFNGDEPILQKVRKASPDEEAAMRRQLEKAGRSRE